MKLALINGDKSEATKGARGFCPSCGSELIARCGEVKVNHWAHKGNHCDPWWENETEWHRSWKSKFPIEWQEVVRFDENGEKHIADVKTGSGYVLEFQHSYLNPEERRSRNAFYSKLVWVVDGARRITDRSQFQKILKESAPLRANVPIIKVHFPDECRLFKEWHDSNALVFFDFQDEADSEQSVLWFLFPKTSSGDVYLSPFSRVKFIELHNNNKFDELVQNIISPIHKELVRNKQVEHAKSMLIHSNRLPGFERHMQNIQRRRRRF